MKIYKGAIVSCDEKDSVFRYLVEDNGKIRFTGDRLPEEFSKEEIYDLGDRALLPAFFDTHIHFSAYAFFGATLDVSSAGDFSEMAAIIREYAAKNPRKPLIGYGVSAHCIPEKRLVEKADLDKWIPSRPLLLIKYDGHASIANSRMLSIFPKKISKLRGYDAETGLLRQDAFFAANDFLTAKVSPFSLLDGMLKSVDALCMNGISTVHTAEGVGFPMDLDVEMIRFLSGALKNPFQFRLVFQTMNIRKVLKRNLPRIGGCFATALDGCFGTVDAALSEPYSDDPDNKGVLFYSDEKIIDFAKQANRAGLQIQIHAIGDAAFDQAVLALETALKDFPRDNHRHIIIHACLPTMSGLEKCAEKGIGIAAQPAFLHWLPEPLSYIESIIGDRALQISPYRTMLDMGIHVSGGSDAPCTIPDPIAGIHAACNHFVPEQSVSIPEALKMYTKEGAWTGFDEKERGSLAEGKIADMVILSANPLETDPSDIDGLRVEKTILSGKPHQPGQGITELFLRRMASFFPFFHKKQGSVLS